MEIERLLILSNFFLCLLGVWVCLCRTGAMRGSVVKVTIRLQYAMWIVALLASAFSWCWLQPATPVQLFLSACVVSHLLIGFAVWRHGPPPYTVKPLKLHA